MAQTAPDFFWDLEQLTCSQISNQNPVSRKKVVPGQLPQRAPAQVIKNPIDHISGKLMNREKLQIDGASAAVGMTGVRHTISDVRRNP